MFVIQDSNNRFCRVASNGKLFFTPDVREAEEFPNEHAAEEFISKNWKKRARNNFRAIRKDNFNTDFQTIKAAEIPNILPAKVFSISNMHKELNDSLTAQVELREKEVRKYEDMLSDIQHFLKDEETTLTTQQCAAVVEKLITILRYRCESKKELQRMKILRAETYRAVKSAESFEYDEYKNKAITDVKAFLFSDIGEI